MTNEVLSECELRFWTRGSTGTEIQHYTIKLTNASIASISFRQPNSRLQPELAQVAEYEEVAFAYQKIQWTWNEGGITAEDDWGASS